MQTIETAIKITISIQRGIPGINDNMSASTVPGINQRETKLTVATSMIIAAKVRKAQRTDEDEKKSAKLDTLAAI